MRGVSTRGEQHRERAAGERSLKQQPAITPGSGGGSTRTGRVSLRVALQPADAAVSPAGPSPPPQATARARAGRASPAPARGGCRGCGGPVRPAGRPAGRPRVAAGPGPARPCPAARGAFRPNFGCSAGAEGRTGTEPAWAAAAAAPGEPRRPPIRPPDLPGARPDGTFSRDSDRLTRWFLWSAPWLLQQL